MRSFYSGERTQLVSVVKTNLFEEIRSAITHSDFTLVDPQENLTMVLTCWVRDSCPDLTQHGQCSLRRRTRRPRCCTSGRTPGGRSGGPGSLSAACVGAGHGEDHPARSPCPGHSPDRNPGPGRNLCRGRSRDPVLGRSPVPAGRSLYHVSHSLDLLTIK